ncbi:MAG: RluA family pseudouridine synthase, partial [Bdellovibrionia bacterium]
MIGLRADKALALDSDISSRSRAAHLIDLEHIKINGKAIKLSYLIKENDEIEIHFPPVMPQELVPLDLKLDVLFEDSDLIVINKPSGLVVHPAAGHENDTLVNALLSHTQDLSMKFNEARPGIVHRLDKETSGILVVAKNDSAHEKLALQFQERTVHRIYHAIVMGTPRQKTGRICSFLARHPNDRKRYASILGRDRKPIQDINAPPEHGKWAATNFEVLSSN